jgi:hypothetical protein
MFPAPKLLESGRKAEECPTQSPPREREESGRNIGIENHENRFADMESGRKADV